MGFYFLLSKFWRFCFTDSSGISFFIAYLEAVGDGRGQSAQIYQFYTEIDVSPRKPISQGRPGNLVLPRFLEIKMIILWRLSGGRT